MYYNNQVIMLPPMVVRAIRIDGWTVQLFRTQYSLRWDTGADGYEVISNQPASTVQMDKNLNVAPPDIVHPPGKTVIEVENSAPFQIGGVESWCTTWKYDDNSLAYAYFHLGADGRVYSCGESGGWCRQDDFGEQFYAIDVQDLPSPIKYL